MIELVVPVVAASLVGSLHCTSMCGGLVAFSTGGPGSRSHALLSYNGARGLGYVTLGGLAGAVGSALDDVGFRAGAGRVAGAVAGLVMIGWGLVKLLELAGVRLRPGARPSAVHVPLTNVLRRLREKPAAVRAGVVGGCTAALPCGFLHAFLVVSAGTGAAARGALVMAAFWLGTLPAVVGLGVGIGVLTQPLRRHTALLGALVLVAFGLSSLLGRWAPPFSSGEWEGASSHVR